MPVNPRKNHSSSSLGMLVELRLVVYKFFSCSTNIRVVYQLITHGNLWSIIGLEVTWRYELRRLSAISCQTRARGVIVEYTSRKRCRASRHLRFVFLIHSTIVVSVEASFVLRAPPNELQSLLCQEFGVSVTNVTRLFLKRREGSLDFGQENKPRHAGADTGFQKRGSIYEPPKGFLCRGSGDSFVENV